MLLATPEHKVVVTYFVCAGRFCNFLCDKKLREKGLKIQQIQSVKGKNCGGIQGQADPAPTVTPFRDIVALIARPPKTGEQYQGRPTLPLQFRCSLNANLLTAITLCNPRGAICVLVLRITEWRTDIPARKIHRDVLGCMGGAHQV